MMMKTSPRRRGAEPVTGSREQTAPASATFFPMGRHCRAAHYLSSRPAPPNRPAAQPSPGSASPFISAFCFLNFCFCLCPFPVPIGVPLRPSAVKPGFPALNRQTGLNLVPQKIKTRKFSFPGNELFPKPGVFQFISRFLTSLQVVCIKSVATQLPAKNRAQKTFFQKSSVFVSGKRDFFRNRRILLRDDD